MRSIPMDGNDHKISGTIKRLTAKGYGWIRSGDGLDHFFHTTELIACTFEDLREGDAMRFVAVETPKGLRANEVERSQ